MVATDAHSGWLMYQQIVVTLRIKNSARYGRCSIPATISPIASEAVRPGLSMP